MALSPIVEIKKPCHENWDSMTPKDKGRFCSSCETVVTDFTKKTPEEITFILKQKATEPACGNFNTQDVITDSKIDKLIWKLNVRGFKYISLLILGVLILIGCRTRHTRGVIAYDGQNPRTLDEIPTKIDTKQNYADTLAK